MVHLKPAGRGTLSLLCLGGWGGGGGLVQAGADHVTHKHHSIVEGNRLRVCVVYHSETLCFYFDTLQPTAVCVCVHPFIIFWEGWGAAGLLEPRAESESVCVCVWVNVFLMYFSWPCSERYTDASASSVASFNATPPVSL